MRVRVELLKEASVTNYTKPVALDASMAGTVKAPAYRKWLALPEITTNATITTEAEMVAANNTPGNYQ